MNLIRLIVLLLICAASYPLSAQLPSVAWGSTNYNLGTVDEVKGLTVDAAGNTYTTGYYVGNVDFDPGPATNLMSTGGFNFQFFVAKYLPGGALQWVFDVTSITNTSGLAIVTDTSGYIYVCGYLKGGPMDFDPGTNVTLLSSSGGTDLFVAKYNGNLAPSDPGFFQWAFRAGGSGDEEPHSIDVDTAGGVVVTGIFEGSNIDFNPSSGSTLLTSAGGDDIFLAKYNGRLNPSQNSFLKWAFRIGGTGPEQANSVKTTIDGTVFLGGAFTLSNVDFDPSSNPNLLSCTGSSDLYLACYNGNLLPTSTSFCAWAFNTGGTGTDKLNAIDIDTSGFLYMTGSFEGLADFNPSANTNTLLSTGYDGFGAKYDVNRLPSDSLFYQWAFHINFATNYYYNSFNALACDENGNFCICGSLDSGLVDFDPSSNTAYFPTSGSGRDIIVARYNGNVQPTDTTFFSWMFSCGVPGKHEESFAIDYSSFGNVHIGGSYYGPMIDFDPSANTALVPNSDAGGFHCDMFVGVYDANTLPSDTAFLQWVNRAGNKYGGFYIEDMTTDAAGNSYTAGFYDGEVDMDPTPTEYKLIGYGTFVMKSDPAGNLVWVFGLDSVNRPHITINALGHIFINAINYGQNTDFDPSPNSLTLPNPLDGVGVCAVMYDVNFVPTDPQFFHWAFELPGTVFTSTGITADDNDFVYMAGVVSNNSMDLDPTAGTANVSAVLTKISYVVKYDGTQLPSSPSFFSWMFTVEARLYAITRDANNQLYMSGSLRVSSDFDPSSTTNTLTPAGPDDFFLAKYDLGVTPSNAAFCKWAFRAGGIDDEAASVLTVDAAGQVYIAGAFESINMDFDPSPDTFHLTPSPSVYGSALFVAKYDGTQQPSSTSFFKWAFTVAASENSSSIMGYQATALTVDPYNNLFLAGPLENTGVDFDPSSTNLILSNPGNDRVFYVMKYDGNLQPTDTAFCKWGFKIGQGSNSSDYTIIDDLKLDNAGSIYIHGYINTINIDLDPTAATHVVNYGSLFAKYNEPCTVPSVSVSPQNTSTCENTVANFSIAVTGSYFSYQWQENNGSNFVNLSNTGIYSGVTTAILSISAPSVALSGNMYRCIVSACSGADTSGIATLTVTNVPVVSASSSASPLCLDDANAILTGLPSGGLFVGPGVSGSVFDPSVGNGTHTIIYSYTDGNGCMGTDTIALLVDPCVGVGEAAQETIPFIYPNPGQGLFTITGLGGYSRLTVYNAMGEILLTQQLNTDSYHFDLSGQAVGVYFVRMEQAKGATMQRLIVE